MDADKVKGVIRQYPTAEGTTAYADVLADRDVDAVVIATPVSTHYELARACLEVGKSCLVEKPLASSADQAADLVQEARSRGSLVMAAHTFLYSPAVQLIKELIEKDELGVPLYVQSSRVNLGIHQSDVSVVWDLAPHDLSILSYWLGEVPSSVSAVGRATQGVGPVDIAFIDLAFPSGCIANLHLSWLAPTKLRRTTLVGSKRMVVYEDTDNEEPVRLFDKGVDLPDPQDFGEFKASYRLGEVRSPRVGSREPLRAEVDDFLSRVANGETPDEREDTAVAIVRTTEAADRSLQEGGSSISL